MRWRCMCVTMPRSMKSGHMLLLCAQGQVSKHANGLLAAIKRERGAAAGTMAKTRSTGFLASRQPVQSSGAQLAANVRVHAAAEPFYTVAALVEDLVRSCWGPMMWWLLLLLRASGPMVQERRRRGLASRRAGCSSACVPCAPGMLARAWCGRGCWNWS